MLGHLQWVRTIKAPTAWENFYVSGALVMGETIYSRYRKKFTETSCSK